LGEKGGEVKLISSYKEEEALILYGEGKMFDFLPRINPRWRDDMNKLETWRSHFEAQDIPFLIIETHLKNGNGRTPRRVYQLWKQKYFAV
jgi:hypothetical protein